MKFRRADCNHWIDASLPPAGHEDRGVDLYPVYLCAECLDRATPRAWPLAFERKDIDTEEPALVAKGIGRGSDGKFLKSRED